jgi:small GTP-binding protein
LLPIFVTNYLLKIGKSCVDVATGECIQLFKEVRHVKVLILGKENVGKTTLMRRVTGNWGIASRLRSAALGSNTRIQTDGIDMVAWKPKEMENTVLHFWDFAGQEIYYATHHFFLHENSINIIVFDCRLSLEENRLLFWLNSIQSMAPGSQVFLIGSFIDQLKDKEKKITAISSKINELIGTWQTPIPSPHRPKFHKGRWAEGPLSFWPLSCIGTYQKIELLCRR